MTAEWAIGTALSLIALMGVFMAYAVNATNAVNSKVAATAKELHERIDGIHTQFVRRDDLNGHLERMETVVSAMQSEQRETNKRIDAVLMAISSKV
jgi:chemotaxis regulatin CheY-phosphate phosphatase CheZ